VSGSAGSKRRIAYAATAFAGLALAAGAIALVTRWPGSAASGIDPDDPVRVALGHQIYTERCASCHGANLEGQPNWQARKPNGRLPAPPHDVSGHTWHHPDQQLIVITRKGLSAVVPGYQSDMPAFEGVLSDEQIVAVLSFIESRWPTEIRSRQRALTSAAS
jgi:mono/diheme cytochrome c family protein